MNPLDFMSSVFTDECMPYRLRKHFGPSKPVVHRETCPVCGRQLVNLYRKDKEWKCRRCWEKEAQ